MYLSIHLPIYPDSSAPYECAAETGRYRIVLIAAVGVEGAIRRRSEAARAARGRPRAAAVGEQLPRAVGGREAPEVVEHVGAVEAVAAEEVQPTVGRGGEAQVAARRRRTGRGGGQDGFLAAAGSKRKGWAGERPAARRARDERRRRQRERRGEGEGGWPSKYWKRWATATCHYGGTK